MNNELNFDGKLDFSEIDLTEPSLVISKILEELPTATHGIISGTIAKYNGPVVSYDEPSLDTSLAIHTVINGRHFDIQEDLGIFGECDKKYECYLYTSSYEKYKYRMFFLQYGIANYPARFTLEEDIARSIKGNDASYIITCKNRKDVEDLLKNILFSKRVVNVMQELIRIHQAKKDYETIDSEKDTTEE